MAFFGAGPAALAATSSSARLSFKGSACPVFSANSFSASFGVFGDVAFSCAKEHARMVAMTFCLSVVQLDNY